MYCQYFGLVLYTFNYLYTYLCVRLDFTASERFAALAFGYINGESDCTNILSNVKVPAFKSFFIPLPELSLHNPPINKMHTKQK